jgi:hypothetical protein
MIYVCVPVHNEASTVGLVLWKVRQVFTAFEREYQIIACDDASTDGTPDVLTSYARVLPLTVVKHRTRQGYARSLEELLRLALNRTDRPKRDCAITLHADFVHAPETMEEMVKRLESGADLVVAEQYRARGERPWPERWARQWAPRLLRVGGGVKDSISGFTALRLIVLRQATRIGDAPLLTTEGWAANAELLARLGAHARRIEVVSSAARYDLKQRPSRSNPWQQLLAAWRSRGRISAARKGAGTAIVLLALLTGGGGGSLRAQDTVCTGKIVGSSSGTSVPVPPASSSTSTAHTALHVPPAVTFPVGERLTFNAKYGIFSVGSATMEVMGIDTVHNAETVHIRFRISGGALWYHLDQTIESWVGRYDFRSRRFSSIQDERDKHREHRYEIYPDSGFYREEGRDTTFATVLEPLDDAAFLYWIRTVPLEVGKKYEYARYFRPDRNPVIIEVLGRDRVSVAGKKWRAIVVRPTIPQGRGIFAEKSETRIWLSDDPQRIVLAIQSNFSFGQVTLKLKDYVVPGVTQQ